MGHSGNAWMISRAVHEVSHNTSETELSTQGRSIGHHTHQPKPESQAGGWAIRKGGGGVDVGRGRLVLLRRPGWRGRLVGPGRGRRNSTRRPLPAQPFPRPYGNEAASEGTSQK